MMTKKITACLAIGKELKALWGSYIEPFLNQARLMREINNLVEFKCFQKCLVWQITHLLYALLVEVMPLAIEHSLYLPK